MLLGRFLGLEAGIEKSGAGQIGNLPHQAP
jgi:hypothetical protein